MPWSISNCRKNSVQQTLAHRIDMQIELEREMKINIRAIREAKIYISRRTGSNLSQIAFG